jgi:hypothetical protein
MMWRAAVSEELQLRAGIASVYLNDGGGTGGGDADFSTASVGKVPRGGLGRRGSRAVPQLATKNVSRHKRPV